MSGQTPIIEGSNRLQRQVVACQIAQNFPEGREGFALNPDEDWLDQLDAYFTRLLSPICGMDKSLHARTVRIVLRQMIDQKNLLISDGLDSCRMTAKFRQQQIGRQESARAQRRPLPQREPRRRARGFSPVAYG